MSGYSFLLKLVACSLLLVFISTMTVVLPTNAISAPTGFAAYSLTGGSDCSNAGSSAVCTDESKQTNIYGDNSIFSDITNIVVWVAGAAAVLILILGGIRYVTSGGDANKVSSAKNTIIAALLGIVVIVLARSLINYVVNKL
jgi:hypothetical protein